MKKTWLLSALLVLIYASGFSQVIKSIGVPYVQNYPKSVYLSGNQNWSVTKDKKGIMYFGNTQGLLTYDGKYWQQYTMPNRQIVRSVAADASGVIYSGSFGEFGYWAEKKGKLTYTSLTKLIPKPYTLTDEIWKIYVDGQRVIFQSFSTIYIYQNKTIKVIKEGSPYLFLHKAGHKYYIESLGRGLFELQGTKLIPLRNSGIDPPSAVLSILPFKNNQLLIGTSKNGLYVYDGQIYSRFATAANDFLSTYQLNNGIRLMEGYFAYGTILNGLIIIDEKGRIIQRINKSSGLQNNTVLGVYADDQKNLWAALDNGIDRIELNSPLYFYFDKNGEFGTVYSSLIYNNNIYLGTNQGLFYSSWPSKGASYSDFNFKLIPNSQGQVWDLHEIDGKLICGHNEGTFLVTGNRMEKISNIRGGWTIKKLNSNPNYLIQGTYNGLALFRKDASNSWIFYHKIEGFGEPSRYVEQDSEGNIWVSHAYKGLYKLGLSSDFKKVIKTEYFDNKNGLPDNYNINLFILENRLVFSSELGFMVYDAISDRFSPYTDLNKKLGSFAFSNKIIPAGLRKYWLINQGKMAIADFSRPGTVDIDSGTFSMLDGRMVQYYENISRISSSIYLISVDDGFAIYNADSGTGAKQAVLPRVLIRQIEDITDTFHTISEDGDTNGEIEIPFTRNNLRISFALPYHRQSTIKFQYFLEGYSRQWSDWSTASQKDFTNLARGKYVFKVRARTSKNTISQITEFKFTVLPPFYASNWAMAFYLAAIVFLLFSSKKLYERKLKKDREKIAAKLQMEKDEFLKKEAEANEKQIIKLQTEKLHAELAGKNRELANSAMSLVYKNELLQKISQEILKLKDKNGETLSEDQLRRIQKVIDEGMNDQRDWNLFESSFNEAHESFFKKLKINHPDLVPNDLKLCAYLRLNMSSKEMASLLNISVRGVEIRRYRLRKKLDVPHDKNLVEFLMEL